MDLKELDNRIEDVKNLIRIWHRFYKTLAMGFEADSITPEREREFLEIKTTVAEKHEAFMNVIEHDHHIGQSILNMIKRTISLAEFGRLSAIEVNKISIEWHDANILLHETLGELEFKREQMTNKAVAAATVRKAKAGPEGTPELVVRAKRGGGLVKLVVTLLILGGLGAAGYYFREQLYQIGFVKTTVDWIMGFFRK